jgi:hypothetical protein
LDKVQNGEADFVPVEPEDMYIASKMPNQHFMIFKEVRTKEEPAGECPYLFYNFGLVLLMENFSNRH